jgi:hypothetical protein
VLGPARREALAVLPAEQLDDLSPSKRGHDRAGEWRSPLACHVKPG